MNPTNRSRWRKGALLLACGSLLAPAAVGAEGSVVEYFNPDLGHYFITADPAEQALLDAGTAGRWRRSGLSFAAGGPDAVCRFYGNTRVDPASGASYGPNSHFYSADAGECAMLQALYAPDRRSWQYEGSGFTTTAASNGQCPAGLQPVYRAYNNGAARAIDPNHRLTASREAYLRSVAAGWTAEGTVMCAPQPSTSATCTPQELAQLENSMTTALDASPTDADFTLLLEADDGRAYRHSRGNSSATTHYESASTSKLVAAATILDLVDRGYLSLDSRPQDLIAFWRPGADNPASAMTLRHLLSFTSGFSDEPPCLNLGSAGFEECVRGIYQRNIDRRKVPGSEFYYASTHLQIAGLMAIRARGFASWSQVFDEFKARSGLFAHSSFDLPSAANPRLAGGMHWTGEDYLAFLRALRRGELLSDTLRAQLWTNQRGAAAVVDSPAIEATGQDWGYGLGNWAECAATTFDCGERLQRNSSPGAYGAYPFVDFQNGYIGLLARQGALGTFANGLHLFDTVREKAAIWASRSCGDDPISGR